MKTNTTTKTETSNIFTFAEDTSPVASTGTRRLDYTPVLQEKARGMALDYIKTVSTKAGVDAELATRTNAMLDSGDAGLLFAELTTCFSQDTLHEAAQVLLGCSEDDLPKMLESQRSNRSKAKKAGVRTKMTTCVAYVTAGLAEMLIRDAMGKPYQGTGRPESLDAAALAGDPEALRRRINSLASKKSRLTKLADYDTKAATELAETENELAELRALRPEKTKTVVSKSAQLATVREALRSLTEEELAALPEAMRALAEKLA